MRSWHNSVILGEAMKNINIVYKKIDELKPYKNNPRKNDKAVKAVADSIKEFGFKVPIILDSNMEIIAGHTRLKAAKRLKYKEVPCIIADDLTPDQVRAFRLVDNKVGEFAEWDIDLLNIELSEIELDLTPFDFKTKKTVNDIEEDEFEVEVPKTPKAKYGDIYKLGEHRLICGDSTDQATLEKLLDKDMVDCLITDPPYNVDYEGRVGKIMNDKLVDREFREFLTKAFTAAAYVMKPGAAFYIWYSDKEAVNFRQACDAANLESKQTLIWNKNQFTLGRQDYQWKHEPCIYGWKRGGSHYFIADRTLQTVIQEPLDIDKMKGQEAKDLLKLILAETQTTIIDVDKPLRNDEHPTMKPLKLIGRQMLNSTRDKEAVLDPFGGSGTTLIAAEQLGRRCYMCELDPKFVDVIINRWEKFTGRKAVKVE